MKSYESLEHAFVEELRFVLANGEKVMPRGLPTLESLECVLRIENPRARLIHNERRKWSIFYAFGELIWHLSASNDVNSISYYSKRWTNFSDDRGTVHGSCYGYKIFRTTSNRVNQWEKLRRLLQDEPTTRRAVLTLYDSEMELGRSSNDLPCSCALQFLIRNDKLNLITYMRSNDLMMGFGYDVFFFTMLQELMATAIGIDLGWYQHVVGSMHIYEKDLDLAYKVADEGVKTDMLQMKPLECPDQLSRVLFYEKLVREAEYVDPAMNFELSSYWREVLDVLLFYKLKRLGNLEGQKIAARRLKHSPFFELLRYPQDTEGRVESYIVA